MKFHITKETSLAVIQAIPADAVVTIDEGVSLSNLLAIPEHVHVVIDNTLSHAALHLLPHVSRVTLVTSLTPTILSELEAAPKALTINATLGQQLEEANTLLQQVTQEKDAMIRSLQHDLAQAQALLARLESEVKAKRVALLGQCLELTRLKASQESPKRPRTNSPTVSLANNQHRFHASSPSVDEEGSYSSAPTTPKTPTL